MSNSNIMFTITHSLLFWSRLVTGSEICSLCCGVCSGTFFSSQNSSFIRSRVITITGQNIRSVLFASSRLDLELWPWSIAALEQNHKSKERSAHNVSCLFSLRFVYMCVTCLPLRWGLWVKVSGCCRTSWFCWYTAARTSYWNITDLCPAHWAVREESVKATHTCVETGVWRFFMSLRFTPGVSGESFQTQISGWSQVWMFGSDWKTRTFLISVTVTVQLNELQDVCMNSVRLSSRQWGSTCRMFARRWISPPHVHTRLHLVRKTVTAGNRLQRQTSDYLRVQSRRLPVSVDCAGKHPDSFLMYTRRQSLGIEQDTVDDLS